MSLNDVIAVFKFDFVIISSKNHKLAKSRKMFFYFYVFTKNRFTLKYIKNK